nr:immunoglobulin light chain junction region [Macaca mulatta]
DYYCQSYDTNLTAVLF